VAGVSAAAGADAEQLARWRKSSSAGINERKWRRKRRKGGGKSQAPAARWASAQRIEESMGIGQARKSEYHGLEGGGGGRISAYENGQAPRGVSEGLEKTRGHHISAHVAAA